MDNNTINQNNLPQEAPSSIFVCGLISLIITLFCCCGGVFQIVAIVLAIIAVVQASKFKKTGGTLSGKASAGNVMAIISIVISVLSFIGNLIVSIIYGGTYLAYFLALIGLSQGS